MEFTAIDTLKLYEFVTHSRADTMEGEYADPV